MVPFPLLLMKKTGDNFSQIFIVDSNRASEGESLLRLNPLGVFYSVVPIEPSAIFNYRSIFPVQTLVAALASARVPALVSHGLFICPSLHSWEQHFALCLPFSYGSKKSY